jgi:prophage antirepressor-like protein
VKYAIILLIDKIIYDQNHIHFITSNNIYFNTKDITKLLEFKDTSHALQPHVTNNNKFSLENNYNTHINSSKTHFKNDIVSDHFHQESVSDLP